MPASLERYRYRPSRPLKHWCANCDAAKVHSEHPETGNFYRVWGEDMVHDTGWIPVVLCICADCLRKEEAA